MKKKTSLFVLAFFLLFGYETLQAQEKYTTKIVRPSYFDKTPPLREMKLIKPGERKREWKEGTVKNFFGFMEEFKKEADLKGPDPVLQKIYGSRNKGGINLDFEGVNNLNDIIPPDTEGDVSGDYYFQMVNLSFAIYDKAGNLVYGPADNSTLWDGFIGSWTGTNDGDPIVMYDEFADRWFASQFAIHTDDSTYWILIAVSENFDPTGSWYRYAYEFSYMPDYPKFGVWRDGYYMSINQFEKISDTWYYRGGGASAFNRDKILAGDPNAEMIFHSFNNPPENGGMLPADAEGILPPENEPCYFARVYPSHLKIFAFDVDWINLTSTFTEMVYLTTHDFSWSNINITQFYGFFSLDVLNDRLMYRLQYRNFGDYQVLLTNHTVNADGNGTAGVRWYEVRDSGPGWTIYQQGTYAPADGNHRWMGSIAMNGNGDIALGYSVTGNGVCPSIRFTGRCFDDTLGQMTVSETSIFEGNKIQTGSTRWGDYSCMSVDPSDNCTFWFTNEYSDGGWNWRTKIASLQITEPVTITEQPVSQIKHKGESATFSITAEEASFYQWQLNGENIAGAVSNTYNIPSVSQNDEGIYTCIVSNFCDTIISEQASLDVVYKITGNVKYENPENTPLSNVTVKLLQEGQEQEIVQTAINGSYEFDTLNPGIFIIELIYNYPWGGGNATDALAAELHAIQMQGFILTGLPLLAADVNASGSINATDALYIKQRCISIINSFPAGDWAYENISIEIGDEHCLENISMLCFGDINGSYNISETKEQTAYIIKYQGVLNVPMGELFELPLWIENCKVAGAVTLFILYNNDLIDIVSVNSYLENIASKIENGNVKIAWCNTDGSTYNCTQPVITLNCIPKKVINGNELIKIGQGTEISDERANVINDVFFKTLSIRTISTSDFSLEANYPNPFSENTTIIYNLPENGFVTLNVLNMMGLKVRGIFKGWQKAGSHTVIINAAGLKKGVYEYKISFNGSSEFHAASGIMILSK